MQIKSIEDIATYSMGEPQAHIEKREYIFVFNRWSVTSLEANLPILPMMQK